LKRFGALLPSAAMRRFLLNAKMLLLLFSGEFVLKIEIRWPKAFFIGGKA